MRIIKKNFSVCRISVLKRYGSFAALPHTARYAAGCVLNFIETEKINKNPKNLFTSEPVTTIILT
jgi:hypothetical protein